MKQIWIVMPALNAEKTLPETFADIPEHLRRNVLLVDDGSVDNTVRCALDLGMHVIEHGNNRGYGANQKTCYQAALDLGAEFVVMLHPDNQYDARMVSVLVEILALGNCDVVLGNRIRSRKEALAGGMPRWKYFANRLSTGVENFILGQTLGDFHSGMRAYTREVLQVVPFHANSNDFAFDQEILVQVAGAGFVIGDVPVPVRYFPEASSINFRRSLTYAAGGLSAVLAYALCRAKIRTDRRFSFRRDTPIPGSKVDT